MSLLDVNYPYSGLPRCAFIFFFWCLKVHHSPAAMFHLLTFFDLVFLAFCCWVKIWVIMKQINVNFLLFISWLNDAYICTCTYILCFPSGCETYEFSYTLFMTNDCLMICLNYQEKRIASKRNYWYISSSVRFMFKWVISPLTAKQPIWEILHILRLRHH